MITCWLGGGAASPARKAKVRDVGIAVSTGDALTVSVTGTEYGLLAAPDDVRDTCPLYTPGLNPLGVTDTATERGVGPDPVAESHGPPENVLAEAATTGLPLSLATNRVCPGGSDPWVWYWKVRLAGDVDGLGRLVTDRVTAVTSKLPLVATIKIVPA
jgi:hypothetical protein